MGVSWLVSSLNVFLRDTAQVLLIVLTFWFWFTPIFFTVDQLPARLRFLAMWNPLAAVVSAYRSCILLARWPSATELAQLILSCRSAPSLWGDSSSGIARELLETCCEAFTTETTKHAES